MSKNIVFPWALMAFSCGVFAQTLPSAGSQLRGIPVAPVPGSTAPRIELKPLGPLTGAEPAGTKISVRQLRVNGAQVYSEVDLIALTGFQPGSELTLNELRAMAVRIADHYHRNGYFAAQAYLPAQDILNGVVVIEVMEGRYGRIVLNNQTNVSEGLANSLMGGLAGGDLIASAPLENRLLLLSDLPGVNVRSTLAPGATIGTSDLNVDLMPGRRVSGSIDADNAGNRYTGENRLGATINLNEPTGHGDVATLRMLTTGSGLNYARAAYQLQFGKARAGVAYSSLGYTLGQEFESLHANGTAKVASVFGSYPVIRSRNQNMYVGLNFDAKTFQDKVDTTGFVADKSADVWTASVNGDMTDTMGSGGLTAYSLAWSSGTVDLKNPSVRVNDALSAQTSGHYDKLGFSLMRLQRVNNSLSVYASVSGQLASKNLDVSEKMDLGGMYAVRAYPQGEASADQGYLLTLEARLQLPKFSDNMLGRVQLIGFVDSGTVTLNKTPWAVGPNSRTLSGAGVGLNWSDANSFSVKVYYARKLGDEFATSAPDASGRFWIQGVKYF